MKRLPKGLYAICDDGAATGPSLVEAARRMLAGGVRVMQLRMKRTPAEEAVGLARQIVALCRAAGALCLINDRVDWALWSNADGAHVGDGDLPPREARQALGGGRLLGVTVRSGALARQAAAQGADYVGLGPLFATGTKVVGHPPLGLAGLRVAVGESPVPVVAIAGIDLGNIGQVARAGAHGAAVLSDLMSAKDVAARARALSLAFESGARPAYPEGRAS